MNVKLALSILVATKQKLWLERVYEIFTIHEVGGFALLTLMDFYNLGPVDCRSFSIPHPDENPTDACERILGRVKSQPALVSGFRVFKAFQMSDEVSFVGSPDKKFEGHYAMVLFGVRRTAAGEYFFLLQNWWKDRHFIEVSAEYMHYCGAIITFGSKAIT